MIVNTNLDRKPLISHIKTQTICQLTRKQSAAISAAIFHNKRPHTLQWLSTKLYAFTQLAPIPLVFFDNMADSLVFEDF